MSQFSVGALVLAGGKGTRMHSDIPKVLQRILDEPLLGYVYSALASFFDDKVWTIVGHRAEMITAAFPRESAKAIVQQPQLGTGHALQTAWSALEDAGLSHVLVVNGDTPQLEESVVRSFLDAVTAPKVNREEPPALAFLSLMLPDPGSFGRVARKNGKVTAIIEAKDHTPDPADTGPYEVNGGIYCLRMDAVAGLLDLLSDNNKSKEFYITDLIGLAVERGIAVEGVPLSGNAGIMGVNTPRELVESEEAINRRIVARHMDNGVIIRNAGTVRIGPRVAIGKGTDITGPCELYGKTVIGEGCVIDSHCKMVDARLGNRIHVQSHSFFAEAAVADGCTVGPYARLRPGADIREDARVGNFVEIKKSVIGRGAKVNHLSYVGDAEVGDNANIGAGTITCNYDGVHKHITRIGKGAFIGSNAALVAPLTIGDDALVGAGSVITQDVPDNMLGIARGRQVVLRRKTVPKD